MKNGIIGWPHVAYAVPAAVNDAIEPASVMPSSRMRPPRASWYESSSCGVDGLVGLTERRVDLVVLEQRVEPERARFVGDDRHDARADAGIAQQVAQQPGERGGGARLHLLAGAGEHVGVRVASAAAGTCGVRTIRSGTGPSSVRRRAIMYSYSGESVPGCQ